CILSTLSIRFGTYNIQSGSHFAHVYNLTETAETINQLDVDIIALQEVDNFTDRHLIDQTLYIAQYNKIQSFEYFHFEKMRNFQNGGYGISILSKQTSIKRLFTYHYNNTTAEQCVIPKEGDYCQGFILIEIPFKYQDNIDLSIYFGTTHLGIGLNGLQQFNEVKQIVQWMSDNIININSSNMNGYTFESLRPSKRINYIFMLKSQNFPEQIKFNCKIQVVPTLSSDHRPVVLNFNLL
ncbi:unnamed protein product, partial [Rotaria sordida]